MPASSEKPQRLLRRVFRFRFLWKAAVAVLILGAGVVFFFGGATPVLLGGMTYELQRGNLPITVVEGGSAESREPHELKCEVKAYRQGVKILSIVEEGYRVTKEDIEKKKELVTLEATEIEERITQKEIEYQTARAAFSKAQQDYEIQEKQNETDIQAGEREARFKGLDLKKYLGEELAKQLMDDLHRRREAEVAAKDAQDAAEAAHDAAKSLEEERKTLEEAKAAKEAEAKELAEAAEKKAGEEKAAAEAAGTEPAQAGDALTKLQEAAKDASKMTALLKELQEDEAKLKEVMKAAQENPEAAAAFMKAAQENPDNAKAVEVLMAKAENAADDKKPKVDIAALEAAIGEAEKALADAQQKAAEAEQAFRDLAAKADGDARKTEDAPPQFSVVFKPIDFPRLAGDAQLGGEAAQKRTTQETDIILQEQDLITARKKLAGTQKLYENDFATQMQLESDQLAVQRGELGLKSKGVATELFARYEFPKLSEQAYSDYSEALKKLDRVKKEASTKLLNAEINLTSAEARFKIQEDERKDNQEQLAKCKIYAEHEGIVVYGGGGNRRFYYGEEPIREGATVREQQTIITIPDITKMGIEVKIHESKIQKVKKGQKATVTVEAFPDQLLVGEVTKVGVVPSSENRWMNPDMKVYEATIAIEGTYEWLKPGMTAEVEIAVEVLKDVLYVPLQAVSSFEGKRICYLSGSDRREVETGEFNDKYIEIKKGLVEGDKVLLRPGRTDEEDKKKNGGQDKSKDKSKPAEPKTAPVNSGAENAAKTAGA